MRHEGHLLFSRDWTCPTCLIAAIIHRIHINVLHLYRFMPSALDRVWSHIRGNTWWKMLRKTCWISYLLHLNYLSENSKHTHRKYDVVTACVLQCVYSERERERCKHRDICKQNSECGCFSRWVLALASEESTNHSIQGLVHLLAIAPLSLVVVFLIPVVVGWWLVVHQSSLRPPMALSTMGKVPPKLPRWPLGDGGWYHHLWISPAEFWVLIPKYQPALPIEALWTTQQQ